MLHMIRLWRLHLVDIYFEHIRKYAKQSWLENFYITLENDPFFPDSLHFILAILVNLP